MRVCISWGLLAGSLLFAGCSGSGSRTEPPAPVQRPGDAVSGGQQEEPKIAAYSPPVQPQLARPQPGRAVQTLMRRASDQQQAGDYVAAASSLERALRIEPQNPELWNQLAHVRVDQKQYGMAADLAAKSNAFALEMDAALRKDNWQIIARARRAAGDTAGARAAEKKAAELP